MSDELERDLVVRLRALGDAVPDHFDAPAELETRVLRRRRVRRRRAGAASVAIALAVGAGVVVAASVSAPPSRSSVNVASPGRVTADQIDPSVVLLDAKGRFVVGLDAGGHQRETLVAATTGQVVDAQVTADHSTIWYLSVSGKPGVDCGNVVRADVTTGASRIMFHSVAFAIDPAGGRIALAGAGNLAQGKCTTTASGAHVSIVSLTKSESDSLPVARPPSTLRWSTDGTTIAAQTCSPISCSVATFRAAPLAPITTIANSSAPMWGSDGLYVVQPRAKGSVAVVRTNSLARSQSTLYVAPTKSLVALPTTAGLFAFGLVGVASPTLLSIGPGPGGVSVATPIAQHSYGTLVPVPALS